jgi:hypothetical protein
VFDGASVFYGSKIILLFGDFEQISVSFGGKEKDLVGLFRWGSRAQSG